MDYKAVKEELTRLRDMDAPKEVLKAYEDVLRKKVSAAMSGKKHKWDPDNRRWIEDPAGIPLGCEAEKPAPSAPPVTVIVKLGG